VDSAVAQVLALVGERWALLVVREVSLGLRRFNELEAATGAPRAVLSDRLRRLTDAGVLTPRPYVIPGSRARNEYVLTDAGYDLLPVLAAVSDWGERHLGAAGSPQDVVYRHGGCGGRVTARLVCECGEEAGPQDRLVAQVNR
jgi:DNA-binding HxlR family transcriptional regulator